MRKNTALFALCLVVSCSSNDSDASSSSATEAPDTTLDAELAKFQRESEDFIEGFDVAKEAGQAFTDAACEAPAAINPKVTYACVATGEDGEAWEFTLEVTGELEFTVTNGAPVSS